MYSAVLQPSQPQMGMTRLNISQDRTVLLLSSVSHAKYGSTEVRKGAQAFEPKCL